MSREYFSGGYFGFAGGFVADAEDRDFFLPHGYLVNISAGAVPSPATLDPAKTSAGIELSDGNLTAGRSGGAGWYASSLSTASGGNLLYAEATFGEVGDIAIGVSNAAIPDSDASGTNNWLGWDTNSIGLFGSNEVYLNSAVLGSFATPPAAGDIIEVWVDRILQQVWFWNFTKSEGTPDPVGPGFSIASLGTGSLYFGFTLGAGKWATANFDGPFNAADLAGWSKWDGTPAAAVTHHTLTADTGALALTGLPASFVHRRVYSMPAAVRAFALTGFATGLRLARKLTAASGAFALTGIAATTRYAHKLIAAPGAILLSGNAAVLRTAQVLSAQTLSISVTGIAATLKHRRVYVMPAVKGTFALTGFAAALSKAGAAVMLAAKGTLTLTGVDAALRAVRQLAAETAVLSLTGNSANLVYTQIVDNIIEALPGSFVLSGKDAALNVWRVPPMLRVEILQFGRPVPLGRW